MENLFNLRNALLKLERSIETGVDPVSGFTTLDILSWVEEKEPFDPLMGAEWQMVAKAAIRRLLAKAEQIKLRNRQIRDLRQHLKSLK